jgi:ribonucleoside-triphosphate reductase
MNDANISYDVVEVESNPEVVSQYSVRSAPTLIVLNGTSYETIVNLSNITAFVEAQ